MKKNTMNSKVKAMIVMGLTMIITIAMSATSFAGSGLTREGAIKAALENAKLTEDKVSLLESEYDEGKYEVEFVKNSNKAEYGYEFSKSGKLLEKSVDYNIAPNYDAKKITKGDAIAKVVDFMGFKESTVSNGSCLEDNDDGQHVFEIHFNTPNYMYEFEVHAATGNILECSKNLINR